MLQSFAAVTGIQPLWTAGFPDAAGGSHVGLIQEGSVGSRRCPSIAFFSVCRERHLATCPPQAASKTGTAGAGSGATASATHPGTNASAAAQSHVQQWTAHNCC